ncbi:MAG: glutamate--tRNA ligase [Rhodospirillales bacterium]|nr:glutamate--tRNA ligase [Rhodospirillales bacterium]
MKLRFAPSPTGYLHVGNARIALANFLFARGHGGSLTLRIDDTDTERSRPEYDAAIRQDLAWLGISWDDSFRQSERLARYAALAEKLKAAGRLYPCFESPEELRAKREARLKRGRAPVYDRAMLAMTAEQRASAEAGGKRPYWRFKLSDGAREWRDLVLGPRAVKLNAVSDPVLIRADGTPLYTLTSVIDDLDTGITHVVRGEDHVTNTGVQIDILEALGGKPGRLAFAHLPLLADTEGGKLSKRLDGLSLRSLRADGMEAGAIAAYLASLGTAEDAVPLAMEQLAARFDFSRISHAPARFDAAQLLALNRRTLHGLDFAAVAARLPDGASEAFWQAVRGNLDLLGEARHWWDVVAGEIAVPAIEGEGDFLRAALTTLPDEPWDGETWKRFTTALREATGRKGRELFHPLRLALTGEEQGPELAALLPLMGRTRAMRRLGVAAGGG